MNTVIYAPVMVTTLCRYEEFRTCMESLSRCTDADKTEVYIGVDYPADESHRNGYRKIVDYLPSISGFRKVNIFMREENWGQWKNGHDLRERIREKYDRFIMTEDDNEFSPNFLLYMNQCLERYKDDSRVVRVCGYSYMEWEDIGDYPFNAFPMQGYCAWGMGGWFSKEQEIRSTFKKAKDIIHDKQVVRKLFSERLHVTVHNMMFRWHKYSGDIRFVCNCALNDKYCIFPSVSKVRNHGFSGNGLHCTTINTYAKQRIDTNSSFVLDKFEIKKYKQIDKLHDKHYAGNFLLRVLTRLEYWYWRRTGKAFRDNQFLRSIMKMRVKWFLNEK